MKHDRNYKPRHLAKKKRNNRYMLHTLFLSLLLVTVGSVGGTLAYLATQSKAVNNTFKPSHVTCEVTENFDGTTKSNVNVTNTSDTDAYIRVNLVSYRVNDAEQHIGGITNVPDFTPGTGWVKNGDYYYYKRPVKPGEKPAYDLIGSINLNGSYRDADGGKQVIEVMAEAIQAEGVADDGRKAVVKAWGVDPETLS